MTDAAPWEATITETVTRFGRLDMLVNSAGVAVLRRTAGLHPADWHRLFKVNLESVYLGYRAAMARMRVQGGGGAIANPSPIAGFVGVAGTGA